MRFTINDQDTMQHIEKVAAKMWYWGPMFRYERPQAGRMRQFYQIGLERIGGGMTGRTYDAGSVIEGDLEVI